MGITTASDAWFRDPCVCGCQAYKVARPASAPDMLSVDIAAQLGAGDDGETLAKLLASSVLPADNMTASGVKTARLWEVSHGNSAAFVNMLFCRMVSSLCMCVSCASFALLCSLAGKGAR